MESGVDKNVCVRNVSKVDRRELLNLTSQGIMSKLVIVESPTKAKTIEKYLPDGYVVRASVGHVRDLPDNASQMPEKYRKEEWAKLGVDVTNGFEPVYVIKGSRTKKTISELKKELKGAEELILATDEDREGEAISWHLVEVLKPKVPVKRMVFHEITKTAIQEALAHTREIDSSLVEAQETRRILDRLVGYPLSLLVAKKIKYGLSAGRVQSVAVRLLVERERERRRFQIGTYWDLKAALDADGEGFEAVLHNVDGTRLASGKDFDENTGKIAEGKDVLLLGEDEAQKLQGVLTGGGWKVASTQESSYKASPKAPFTTSTLQQEASRKLGMGAREAMSVAQRLYEEGFITYMRTDSTNLSQQAIGAARNAATKLYGADHVPEEPRIYTKKSKGAQEAHEAIRPSGDAFVRPEKSGLSGRELQLYDLIWKRTVASQMADAQRTSIRYDIQVEHDGKTYEFRAHGNRIDFAGHLRAYVEGSDDPDAALEDQERLLPPLAEGDKVDCQQIEALCHETRPPARYTEASLVKALEEFGVGRPSTYATIMDKITSDDRYAKRQGRTLVPTFMAFAVTSLLEKYFPDLVDTQFTARLEDDLDDIARGAGTKTDYLHRFYRAEGAFADQISQREEDIEPDEARVIELEHFPATLRVGRYGPYVQIEEGGETKTVDVPEDVAPADLAYADVEQQLQKREEGPAELGEDPESGETVYLIYGPYGYYVQRGEKTEENKKPKRASLPKGEEPEGITLERALDLLSLPRTLGKHPEDNKVVQSGIGRYGPYVRHNKEYRSLQNNEEVFTVSLEEALELLSQPKKRRRAKVLKELGVYPKTGKALKLYEGRYGPYMKVGRKNISLPKGFDPEELSLEKAIEIIEEKGT